MITIALAEAVYELAQNQGIWCLLAVMLVIRNDRKLNDLENWVRGKVLSTLEDNTKVLAKVEERLNDKSDRKHR